ncbi:Adenosylhomocysteinase [Legionella massiliensis]|uniref:Adenosylhomocysteinase n=1 Tax=Legionella massiliensis TaxID=1034943 RepID=A0A078KPZ9_9GAMM|nr:NAD-binding protein [Legionella massiliensis]CDZ76435.1 Adenosylhomocysteinase [Legionella massiliensis]CEE12173.1 Adenosylhomocysteinase [Legionella massiliensis]
MLNNQPLARLVQHNASIFRNTKALLLDNLKQLWSKTKPLAGIKILHNIPLTYETLVKLESLVAAGADLTVTQVKFVSTPPTTDIVDLLSQLGITYTPQHEDIEGEFDIALDCCAEVMQMPKVTITKGLVELTQSGGEVFKKTKTAFPVINVDDSNLKKLEGMYGTGESFVRAFKERTNRDIKNETFMVFGFGKVGQGIVKYLLKETPHITVVERSEKLLEHARKMGINALHVSQAADIRNSAQKASCLVTATGQHHVLSQWLSSDLCPQALIANMGVADEIGPNFTNEKILCNRTAINFSLKHPTLLHFIDPIFYAHNLGAQLLLENQLSPGYHPFPSYIDDLVIKLWNAYYPIDISDIYLEH